MRPLFAKPTSPKPVSDISKARTLLVFDASNIAARAHHAFWANSQLTTRDGRKSGHIFGVLRMLQAAFKRFRKGPTAIVIAIEGYTAHRYCIFPDYKAHRRSNVVPDDVPEDPRVEQISAMFAVPCFGLLAPLGEADDAIASFVRSLGAHQTAYVFSSDRDLWQLVTTPGERSYTDAQVTVVIDKYAKVDSSVCVQRLKAYPNQVALLKSVYGDPSDGIPKVKRIPKTFKAEFCENRHWVTPDDLFADLGSIDPKAASKIREYEDQIRLMYKVVSLDLQCHFILEQFGSKVALNDLIQTFEMNSLRDLLETWF